MKTKNYIPIIFGMLFCLVTASCISTGASRWSVQPPQDVSVWHRPVTVTLSNVTPDVALSMIESNVLSQTGEKVYLSYGCLPEPFDNLPGSRNDHFSITVSNMLSCELVKFVADIQNQRVLFHKRSAVLAPSLLGCGMVTIQLTGRCTDAVTGARVPAFDVAKRHEMVMTDSTGGYSLPLEVDGFTLRYYVEGHRAYYSGPHPDEKEITLSISASHYEPRTIAIKLQPQSLIYTNDISLKPIIIQRDGIPSAETRR